MPEHPHQYSLPEWAPDPDERAWFVALIRQQGYKGEPFWGSRWTYLELGDGFKELGAQGVVGRRREPMLNRANLDGPGQMRMEIEP